MLVGVSALIASTMLLGYVQDEKINNRGMSNAAFWFGWVPYVAAWALVITRFFNTVSSDRNVPGFVKSIIWIELAVFTCFALTQYWFVVRPGAVYNQQSYDGTYNTLSITAKTLLVAFAYFGLKGMNQCEEDNMCPGDKICSESKCIDRCYADQDCAGGDLCDRADGRCKDVVVE